LLTNYQYLYQFSTYSCVFTVQFIMFTVYYSHIFATGHTNNKMQHDEAKIDQTVLSRHL